MLERPEIKESRIVISLKNDYGINVQELKFLPLGADQNTAVFRIEGADKQSYFLKLRKDEFNVASVSISYFLSQTGMKQVIPPMPTLSGKLWSVLENYNAILYPFIVGHDGFECQMTADQWFSFGQALKRLHSTAFPAELIAGIPHEKYSPVWRDKVKSYLARFKNESFNDPDASELVRFLTSKETETIDLINRSERYAKLLKNRKLPFILCHADIHGWNLLIDKHSDLYIVDWDTLLIAPKERDLMFIGSGPGNSGYTPQEEESMFYQGYGPTELNRTALAYYRYERIIEDLAVYCDQIFLSDQVGKDRQVAVANVKSNYLPGATIDKALQADQSLV